MAERVESTAQKVVIINKSDSTGGAAVVSFRLMEAMRERGVDARMLVAEKLTDSPYVQLIASPLRLKAAFAADRLRIALAHGAQRSTLFKLDAAAFGIDVADLPAVKEADIVIINWINQGVLSLKGIRRLTESGKRVVWTMHDMWNMTGLCHHAGDCGRFLQGAECGECPLLGKHGSPNDLSHRTWLEKRRLYADAVAAGNGMEFVAVSTWLRDKALASGLLHDACLRVIPNLFRLPEETELKRTEAPGRLRLIFGAARLDDDIKDLPLLIGTLSQLSARHPELASRTSLTLYGGIRDASILERLRIPYQYHGLIRDPAKIRDLYLNSDIVLSTSRYETLPGTLVEGQAYGCLPVAAGLGGQPDIIHDGLGIHLPPVEGETRADYAARLADAIADAARMLRADAPSLRHRMRRSLEDRFFPDAVVAAYLHP